MIKHQHLTLHPASLLLDCRDVLAQHSTRKLVFQHEGPLLNIYNSKISALKLLDSSHRIGESPGQHVENKEQEDKSTKHKRNGGLISLEGNCPFRDG